MPIWIAALGLLLPIANDAPVDTTLSSSGGACAESIEPTPTVQDMGGFALPVYGEERLLKAGRELVSCELEAGNVVKILFMQGSQAIATLSDGTELAFRLENGMEAWFAAYAAGLDVQISSTMLPAIPPMPEKEPRESSTWPGILALTASVGVVAVLGTRRYRKHQRSRKLVQIGVGEEVSTKTGREDGVPETRFSDVAGCKEAIEDLREMVDILKNPGQYQALGARTPKGALLVGPPGTGKTLLARAVAGEAGVPFFSAAGSDFVEMYVGVGAKRVREVFTKARRRGKGIVFIDEIDAVGRKRSSEAVHAGEQEHENTLIALLNELDGFRESGIVIIAATNRPEILDPALTRPGRLDRRIHVGLPDVKEREEILGVHARGKPLAEATSLADIAQRTPGMSGAQLEQVCNEAALLAARNKENSISALHLHQAVEYVVMGRARKSATISAEDRLVTAWHEAGHAVAALKHPDATPPVAISITPRGEAGGVTWMQGKENVIVTRRDLKARLVVAFGGRCAEEMLMNGEYTAGAANDLLQATETARAMVEKLGMSGGLSVRNTQNDASEEAVETLLREAAEEAREILREHRELLECLAESLLERDDITLDEISELVAEVEARD
jgi:cell division protease FtsH